MLIGLVQHRIGHTRAQVKTKRGVAYHLVNTENLQQHYKEIGTARGQPVYGKKVRIITPSGRYANKYIADISKYFYNPIKRGYEKYVPGKPVKVDVLPDKYIKQQRIMHERASMKTDARQEVWTMEQLKHLFARHKRYFVRKQISAIEYVKGKPKELPPYVQVEIVRRIRPEGAGSDIEVKMYSKVQLSRGASIDELKQKAYMNAAPATRRSLFLAGYKYDSRFKQVGTDDVRVRRFIFGEGPLPSSSQSELQNEPEGPPPSSSQSELQNEPEGPTEDRMEIGDERTERIKY